MFWQKCFSKKKGNFTRYFYQDLNSDQVGSPFEGRWKTVADSADLKKTDSILDIGCAEGLITMKAAEFVEKAEGIEIFEHRVKKAQEIAAEQNIQNVSFSVGSIQDVDLTPEGWDIIFFLGVYGVPTDTGPIGDKELDKVCKAARRQVVMRYDIEQNPSSYANIIRVFEENDYSVTVYAKTDENGNIIVGNRKSAQVDKKPNLPFVLVPNQ